MIWVWLLIVVAELQLLVLAVALCRAASRADSGTADLEAPSSEPAILQPTPEEAAHQEQVKRFLARLHAEERHT